MNLKTARWSGTSSAIRLMLLAGIWWGLSGGAPASWWIGVPAVLLATAASVALLPPIPLVWHELPRFIPFFLARSLSGGVDVAWRALHPSLPIAPVLVEYPLQLPPGLPRVFMANSVSLLPGTLSAALDQSLLKVHLLDGRKDFLAELKDLEQRVARLFGVALKISA